MESVLCGFWCKLYHFLLNEYSSLNDVEQVLHWRTNIRIFQTLIPFYNKTKSSGGANL